MNPFETFQVVHEYDKSHKYIKTNIKYLFELNIQNWEYNRPPDEVRCSEIRDYYANNHFEITQPFHFYFNSKKNIYYVLDGIHRYTGLTMIEKDEEILDKTVFIHIYSDISEGKQIDIFRDLNKSVPIPNLYMNMDSTNTEKNAIEEVVKLWQKNYKEHFSSSQDYRVPQINREAFTNLVQNLYNYYKIRNKQKLEEVLESANEKIKNYVLSGVNLKNAPNKFSEKQREKCKKTDCYLFLYKEDTIKWFLDQTN